MRAILAVHSYRQMYALACEIVGNTENEAVRDAADKVVARLKPVVDLPVADGAELSIALRAFLKLIAHLQVNGHGGAKLDQDVAATYLDLVDHATV
ncbi:hypothetical protein YH62_05200 [Rhizobium sp. LC145]|nr:hypothetical protein YH62_05200 [Rhizobium sp. LC145]